MRVRVRVRVRVRAGVGVRVRHLDPAAREGKPEAAQLRALCRVGGRPAGEGRDRHLGTASVRVRAGATATARARVGVRG